MSISGSLIVQDALTACGAYGIGDNLADADAQLVLRRLNRMIESWGNTGLLMHAIELDTFTMSANVPSYNTTTTPLSSAIPRFLSVDSCYVTLDGTDFPVSIIPNTTYYEVRYKASAGTPEYLYPKPNGNTDYDLFFYPAPDTAYVCTLAVRRLLTATRITVATTFDGPPGYEKAIIDNLAVDIASSFGRPADPAMMAQAGQSLLALTRRNYQPLMLGTPYHKSDIFAG